MSLSLSGLVAGVTFFANYGNSNVDLMDLPKEAMRKAFIAGVVAEVVQYGLFGKTINNGSSLETLGGNIVSIVKVPINILSSAYNVTSYILSGAYSVASFVAKPVINYAVEKGSIIAEAGYAKASEFGINMMKSGKVKSIEIKEYLKESYNTFDTNYVQPFHASAASKAEILVVLGSLKITEMKDCFNAGCHNLNTNYVQPLVDYAVTKSEAFIEASHALSTPLTPIFAEYSS